MYIAYACDAKRALIPGSDSRLLSRSTKQKCLGTYLINVTVKCYNAHGHLWLQSRQIATMYAEK